MSENEYKQLSVKSHMITKSMWDGGNKGSSGVFVYIDNKIIHKESSKVSTGFITSINEVLTNASDAAIKNSVKIKQFRTTCIDITYDEKSGKISAYNDGMGIPLDKQIKDNNGNIMWIPQMVFTIPFSGSNTETKSDRITGGVNGIGVKLTVYKSYKFRIETTDRKSNKYYSQDITNTLTDNIPTPNTIIDEPYICKYKSTHNKLPKGGTRLTWVPNYELFGIDIKNKENMKYILGYIKARLIELSVYNNIKCIFNGDLIDYRDCKKFSKLFINNPHTQVFNNKNKWIVSIGSSQTLHKFSIVNGIVVDDGCHFNHIIKQITEELHSKVNNLLKTKYTKIRTKNIITNVLTIVLICMIPDPIFSSQTKNNIKKNPNNDYSMYKLSNKLINKLWKDIEQEIINKHLVASSKKKNNKPKETIKKYTKALNAGSKKHNLRSETSLVICEGDSASSTVNTAITSRDKNVSHINRDNTGIFIIGGVPVNARKECDKCVNNEGKTYLKLSKKLENNERFKSLECVINLYKHKTYETKEDIKTLNYGGVVLFVDQDLDGVGQIAGLILSMFYYFYPGLFNHGYIKIMYTPIIRAMPNSNNKTFNKIKSFYTDQEFNSWMSDNKLTDKNIGRFYDIRHYKGLASHSVKETVEMFRQENKPKIYISESNSEKYFEIYYGNNTDIRKKQLISQYIPEHTEDIKNNQISLTTHLTTYTQEYAEANIKRKLPESIDGFNKSQRKVTTFCINNSKSTKEQKVYQFASNVAVYMSYAHGGASMEGVVTGMTQSFVGSRNIGLLLGQGQFGTRAMGGKDAGASRYIFVKSNKILINTLFKTDDMPVLEYIIEEGKKLEPVYLVPTIPLALFESRKIPSNGWQCSSYSRDIDIIKENIEYTIDNEDLDNLPSYSIMRKKFKKMPFWNGVHKWKGEIRSIFVDKKDYKLVEKWFVGRYNIDNKKNTIHIYELPYRCWTNDFIDKLNKKQDNYISQIKDNSTCDKIDIQIIFKRGAIQNINNIKQKRNEFSSMEEYLLIYKKMDNNLNMLWKGRIKEYKTYKEILYDWIVVRYDTYKKRINRNKIIIAIKIDMMENVIKYIEDFKKYDLNNKDEKQIIKELIENKYKDFNIKILGTSDDVSTSELVNEIYITTDQTFNYLLDITDRQKLKPNVNKKIKKLKELKNKLKELSKPLIIKHTWKKELNEAYDIIYKAMDNKNLWDLNKKEYEFD